MQIGSVISDDLVQFVTLALCFVGIYIWLRWANQRGSICYAVAPIIFFVHRAVYYIVITFNHSIPNEIVVMWSSAISLHSVITIILGALSMIIFARRRSLANES